MVKKIFLLISLSFIFEPQLVFTVPAKDLHIKRPMNSFMLFRQAENQQRTKDISTQQEFSKKISNKWKKLSNKEKLAWEMKAKEEAIHHRRINPNYKYQPKKKKKCVKLNHTPSSFETSNEEHEPLTYDWFQQLTEDTDRENSSWNTSFPLNF